MRGQVRGHKGVVRGHLRGRPQEESSLLFPVFPSPVSLASWGGHLLLPSLLAHSVRLSPATCRGSLSGEAVSKDKPKGQEMSPIPASLSPTVPS